MKIIQPSTLNNQPPTRLRSCGMKNCLVLGGCLLGVLTLDVQGQAPVQFSPGVVAQMQLQQAPVEVASPETVTAKAEFDPPIARPGENVIYRVALDATRNSIEWPESLPSSPNLKLGPMTAGQITRVEGNKYRPLTMFVGEALANEAGRFTISNFMVACDGKMVTVPAASFEVLTDAPTNIAPRPRLLLQASTTNLFAGQPFRLRVVMPAGPGNSVEALRDVQFNGNGIMSDKTQMRQAVENIASNGQLRPAFVYETVATPIASGRLRLSAQAFTAGRDFSGPITISGGQVTIPGGPPSYILQLTETMEFNVRPLPTEDELPGFTGAIGKFLTETPQLSTNRVRIGEPVHLKFGFRSEGNLARYVPPAMPRSREWQIILDRPPGDGLTLIPLTDEATHTPAIPFSAFDPALGMFYDLTIPAQSVTVIGEGLPVKLAPLSDGEKNSAPLKLSGLMFPAGKTVKSLTPLQLQGWFVVLQMLPVAGFIALWRWDSRRRYLEAHPEIVRRRQARKALRLARRSIKAAVVRADAKAFVQHAATAMSIAVAPHYPANPEALVGSDVLAQMNDADRNAQSGETVQIIFAAANSRFALSPQTQADLLGLNSRVELVLLKLEESL
jgi:hypothetical protein